MTFEQAKNLISDIIDSYDEEYGNKYGDALMAYDVIMCYAEKGYWTAAAKYIEEERLEIETKVQPTSVSNPPAAKENPYGSNKFNL